MSTENEKTVTALFDAWKRLDFIGATGLLTDSFTFQADPSVSHRSRVQKRLERNGKATSSSWRGTDFKISHMLSAGNVVMMERVESIGTKKGKTIELPIVGVFELTGGKISVWRDYWDPRMALPPAPSA